MSATEQAAANLYTTHFPGGNWSKVPDGIKRAYRRAAAERANHARCTNCGRTADDHPTRSVDGCAWKTTPATDHATSKED